MSDAPVRAGLDAAAQLKPGHGQLELAAVARGEGDRVVGAVRGELAAKLTPDSELFARGEFGLSGRLKEGLSPEWSAMGGFRMRF